MPSLLWAIIAASAGFMFYLLPAAFGPYYHPQTRTRVARFYMDKFARTFGKIGLIKRKLGEYDIKRVTVDQEKPALKLTFKTGGLLGDDQELYFRDPANRMKRLFNKPFFFFHESIPAAVDLELAELGYYWHKHIEAGNAVDDTGEQKKVNPYFKLKKTPRAINLDSVISLVTFGSKPDDAKTIEAYTRQRFAKYGRDIGVAETVSVLMGFVAGLSGVAVLQYLNKNIIEDSGGSTGPIIPMGYIDVSPLVDLLTGGLL